jgi:maleate isomerase
MQPSEHLLPREQPLARPGQHAGVLVPWANSIVESELPRWAGISVAWHYARLVPISQSTALDEDFLSGLLAAVPAALAQLVALPLERVYLACTSASFMLPRQAQAAAEDAQVAIITAFDAIVSALRHWRCDRIVLLTPYPEKVCQTEADTFENHGIVVTGHATLNMDDGYSAIGPGQIRALATKVSRSAIEEAQAIVLSCTGWPTWGLEKGLAQAYGKKVVSSNLAIVTHALRTGGLA